MYASVVLGIFGQFTCTHPGREFQFFAAASVLAAASFSNPKWSYRSISMVLLLLFSVMSFFGYSRAKKYQQWLKANPSQQFVEQNKPNELLIVAHRGASRDAPQNTIPAFDLAWKQGADAIEGDFRLTKDAHIVCIHDASTEKVADENLTVRYSTLDQLRQLDVGIHHSKEYTAAVIPTIAEVFATVPDQRKIYIEIKCGTEIIPELLDEITRSGLRQEQIIIIAFNENLIRQLKDKAPQFKALWLVSFKRNKYGRITPSLEYVQKTLRQIKADGLSSSSDLVSKSFIKSVMEQGYEYHVWTVDDPKTARRFKKWGAMSITTNLPGYIKKNLTE